MTILSKLYAWVWFHTEFWMANKLDRRPFTFIMRDWIFLHPGLAAFVIVLWFAGCFALAAWYIWIALILGILSSFVLAHVVWGSPWLKGQQEQPTYLGEE